MARRTVSVGVDEGYIRALGEVPWETRLPRGTYVVGRWSDEGPLSAVTWMDLDAAYARNRIDRRHALWFELWLCGLSIRRIAEHSGFGRTHVGEAIAKVRSILEGDPHVGLIAVVLEWGGWDAVAELLFG